MSDGREYLKESGMSLLKEIEELRKKEKMPVNEPDEFESAVGWAQ